MSDETSRIPSATYRLQFHAGFTFRDALDILDYLKDLGISDVYASPYFQAAPDSTHGYDVANHNRLNPEVGDNTDFRAYVSGLNQRGMGQILDFVPNHMGIGQSLNSWWMGVLEDGIESPFATYFDIDWQSARAALEHRVLLPILGDLYGRVLERGEFKLSYRDGKFTLHYFETRLPLNPRSYAQILNAIAACLDGAESEEMRGLSDRFAAGSEKEASQRELEALASRSQKVREAIEATLRRMEGHAGDPKSFDDLHDLLQAQAYRLSYWRVAAEEINYRRFFDINTLAAIRVEIPEVFEAAHKLVFELLARGDVFGLRIDHIDGLWDPKAYLERLHRRSEELGADGLYVVVEKILDPMSEHLPTDWPVHGTTGYEFANQVVELLVDSNAAKRMTEVYRSFSGVTDEFEELVYEKKKLTMQISLGSELSALARMLDELSEMYRHYRDFTVNTLTSALREVIACFPVYRTYVRDVGGMSHDDEKVVLRAIGGARRRNPTIEHAVFDFLRNVLLLRIPDYLSQGQREAHLRFVMKFQQCTGPVMAKGLEDTAFYIYNRLVALNEVGGHPGVFGIQVQDFHRMNAARRERTPHTLLASSTHDTKRSEDVRMRIAALSELPEQWRVAIRKWSRLNKKHRTNLDGELAPSANEECLIYQTLIGSWPLAEEDRSGYLERIQRYMMKALKEAKINSSWTEPNEDWEEAVNVFIARILDEEQSPVFRGEFVRFAERIAPIGAMNSLTHTVLKCTSPGVPDFYQGTEIWDFSLVDPDNRRPVDFKLRRAMIANLAEANPAALVEDWTSGRIKLMISRALLHFRREHEAFFKSADYQGVDVTGSLAPHVVAYLRSWNEQQLLVVVPRLTAQLGDFPRGETWRDTAIQVPGDSTWREVFTGSRHAAVEGVLPVSDTLGELPVAVLWRQN